MTDVGDPPGPMRIERLPLRTYAAAVAALSLLVALGSWGTVQLVHAVSGSDCQPVSSDVAHEVTRLVGLRRSPLPTTRPPTATPGATLVNAWQVDDHVYEDSIHYVAGSVLVPGRAPRGPGVWRIIDANEPPFDNPRTEVSAYSDVAHELTPTTGLAWQKPLPRELVEVEKCARTGP